jgi:hypothetical protein
MSSLITCTDCKKEISKKAKACPHCGAPIKRSSILKIALLLLLTLWIIGTLASGGSQNGNFSTPAITDSHPASPQTPVGWQYTESDDPMSSKKIKYAINQSTNFINLDFPYQGPQQGVLTVRKHPRHGNDVIFGVQKGQIMCSSYSGCNVLIRFDDKPAQKFSAKEPEDNSTETIFISNYTRFVATAKKSKTLTLQVSFYQQGTQTFTFNTENLIWN